MKRVVFDLDGTLLTGSFDFEMDYFTGLYGEDGKSLVNNMGKYLDEYEKTFLRYKHERLSKFLSLKSGMDITSKVIDGWLDYMIDVPDTMEDGVIETLEHLKSNDCSIAVLTNWYAKAQLRRLERAGILPYFDNVYTGNFVLKPHKCAYVWAQDGYSAKDCLFVGDDLDKDYFGPRKYGFESVIYDKNDVHDKSLKKIKRINEIIER